MLNKPKTHLSLFVFFIILYFNASSQQDFNHFKTLAAVGKIPSDFSALTYEKIDVDLEKSKAEKGNLSASEEKTFLKDIHYGIDGLLHSGNVTYGDEVSLYLEKIADKLLKKEPELRKKLRFYVYKTNEVNAFSTNQGIVFVTTGLISQLLNESQLALILGHEIAHFTEKHVVADFEHKIENKKRRDFNILELSKYSKEHEMEADKIGLKWYHDAGYSKEEVTPTFDVIMYSYLPFDEVEFPVTYFNTKNIFVPETLFPTVKYEIKAEEDYDDSQSSHPNIKKRKEEIQKQLQVFSNWKDNVYLFEKEKFEYIRNICRFESVRNDILNSSYGRALYSIFLLEKDFPNSLTLKQYKAQTWLGLVQFKKAGIINKAVDKNSELEGEIAALHFFLKKMNTESFLTLALRQVYDIRKQTPKDTQIEEIYKRLLKEAVSSKNFKLDSYSSMTFNDAATNFLNKRNKVPTTDTLATAAVTDKKVNKYDKIKNKKSAENIDNFDSTKFYVYGISDIIIDQEFKETINGFQNEFDLENKKTQDFEALSYKKRQEIIEKEEETDLNIGVNELIFVEPMIFHYKNGTVDRIKSEKLKQEFSASLKEIATELEITTYTFDRNNLEKSGTTMFNETSTLLNFVSQVSNEDKFDIFPVDFELLEELKKQYGTSKVVFSWVEYEYDARIKFTDIAYMIYLFPAIPFIPVYITVKVLTGSRTQMNFVVLDFEKGEVEAATNYYFKDKPKKHQLGSHIYNILKKIKTPKTI
jgi:predicted Zn-dependent protease